MKHEEEPKRQEVLAVGAFRYDRTTGQISDADGKIVRLRRQSEAVLSVLAEDAGEIVSRERLIDAVWPGIATTDDSLIQCIADIRRNLGREVVETFPKKATGSVLAHRPLRARAPPGGDGSPLPRASLRFWRPRRFSLSSAAPPPPSLNPSFRQWSSPRVRSRFFHSLT